MLTSFTLRVQPWGDPHAQGRHLAHGLSQLGACTCPTTEPLASAYIHHTIVDPMVARFCAPFKGLVSSCMQMRCPLCCDDACCCTHIKNERNIHGIVCPSRSTERSDNGKRPPGRAFCCLHGPLYPSRSKRQVVILVPALSPLRSSPPLPVLAIYARVCACSLGAEHLHL